MITASQVHLISLMGLSPNKISLNQYAYFLYLMCTLIYAAAAAAAAAAAVN
jgi:hypothetical protein